MKLYLVRHGDAVDTSEDQQRPLSAKGLQEVKIIANFLADNDVFLEQVYHSGKLRAEQTANTLISKLPSKPKISMLPGLLPDDDVKSIAVYCNHWNQNTMLVGHLPFMSKLVSEMLIDREDKLFIDFPTAAILCLERVAMFQWYIAWFVNASLLAT